MLLVVVAALTVIYSLYKIQIRDGATYRQYACLLYTSPLSGGKRIVDVEQIRDYLDEIRDALAARKGHSGALLQRILNGIQKLVHVHSCLLYTSRCV